MWIWCDTCSCGYSAAIKRKGDACGDESTIDGMKCLGVVRIEDEAQAKHQIRQRAATWIRSANEILTEIDGGGH